VQWVIDGNNVMGAGADRWWNDPVVAAARLTQAIAEWTRTHDDDVTIVYDGAAEPRLTELAGGRLTVTFATRRGRNAADDRIVELVEDLDAHGSGGITVVTSDRGLSERLPPAVTREGAGRFRTRIGVGRRRGSR